MGGTGEDAKVEGMLGAALTTQMVKAFQANRKLAGLSENFSYDRDGSKFEVPYDVFLLMPLFYQAARGAVCTGRLVAESGPISGFRVRLNVLQDLMKTGPTTATEDLLKLVQNTCAELCAQRFKRHVPNTHDRLQAMVEEAETALASDDVAMALALARATLVDSNAFM